MNACTHDFYCELTLRPRLDYANSLQSWNCVTNLVEALIWNNSSLPFQSPPVAKRLYSLPLQSFTIVKSVRIEFYQFSIGSVALLSLHALASNKKILRGAPPPTTNQPPMTLFALIKYLMVTTQNIVWRHLLTDYQASNQQWRKLWFVARLPINSKLRPQASCVIQAR